MLSFSPITRQAIGIARTEMSVLEEEGFVAFLRTSSRKNLEFLGSVLRYGESMRMDASDVQQRWAERTGDYSPDFYATLGPDDSSEAIRGVLDGWAERDDAILELGCSAGRHLAYLHERGYENLHGIDINAEALDAMERTFPDLAGDGTFYVGSIENVLPRFADDQFDAVFSVETLQHVHPDNDWVFAELARITRDVLITVENEGEEGDYPLEFAVVNVDNFPLYHRKWKPIFTELGFEAVRSKPDAMDTFRVFRKR